MKGWGGVEGLRGWGVGGSGCVGQGRGWGRWARGGGWWVICGGLVSGRRWVVGDAC